jgi:hypothetical protein
VAAAGIAFGLLIFARVSAWIRERGMSRGRLRLVTNDKRRRI